MTSRYLAPWSSPFSESGQASIGLDRFQAPLVTDKGAQGVAVLLVLAWWS